LVDTQDEQREAFSGFFAEIEPRLRHALIARYGLETGREATADALAYAWEHWTRIKTMHNPVGYLYRVGRTTSRRYRSRRVGFDPEPAGEPWTEPALPRALGSLSDRQRMTVVLRHSFRWTHAEIAELLGISIPTVQKHLTRGVAKLRRELGVESRA
jgi:DNA-directed RNA polymerase specialized sigma24 family protein